MKLKLQMEVNGSTQTSIGKRMTTDSSKVSLKLVDILDQPIKNLKVEVRTAAKVWHSGTTNAAGIVEFFASSGKDLVVHVEHWLHKEMKPVAKFFSGLDDIAIKLVSPKVKQTVSAKPNGPAGDYLRGTYKVKAGDALSKIAKVYGVSDDYLAQINHIKDKNALSVGQVLKVPPVKTRRTTPQKHNPAPTAPPHSASSAEVAPKTANGPAPTLDDKTNADGKPVAVLPVGQPAVIFPFKVRPLNDVGGIFRNNWRKIEAPNAACFGSSRSGGGRRHAARDLYAHDFTEVFAIAPGKVLRIAAFYCKTHQVSVHHTSSDGRNFIVRYGELDPSTIDVKVGDEVAQGKLLGRTGILRNSDESKMIITEGKNVSMLHFELFSGAAGMDNATDLTSRSGQYQRRSDLIDPLTILQEGYFQTFRDGTPSLKKVTEERIPVSQLKLSALGEAFIKDYEKLRLNYYDDAFGYCTVGWGNLTGGKTSCASQGIPIGKAITLQDAKDLFDMDKNEHEDFVKDAIRAPLYQHEYDALCSLAFNIGRIAKKAPTLCRKINNGDYEGGAIEFLDITNNGVTGLVKRRAQENLIFSRANYDSSH